MVKGIYVCKMLHECVGHYFTILSGGWKAVILETFALKNLYPHRIFRKMEISFRFISSISILKHICFDFDFICNTFLYLVFYS